MGALNMKVLYKPDRGTMWDLISHHSPSLPMFH